MPMGNDLPRMDRESGKGLIRNMESSAKHVSDSQLIAGC